MIMCVCGLQQPAAQINTSNVNLADLWNLALMKDTTLTLFYIIFSFFKDFIYLLLEGKGRRKRGRETSMCGCLSCTPFWGSGPQTRHVSWLGIELATLWFASPHTIHWAMWPGCFYIINVRDAMRNHTKTQKSHASFIMNISTKSNQVNPKVYFACCIKCSKSAYVWQFRWSMSEPIRSNSCLGGEKKSSSIINL